MKGDIVIKAKSLKRIGCVTAIVSIVMLLMMLVYELYTYRGGGKAASLLTIHFCAILFPVTYLLAVIKKRLKILWYIFIAWCFIWLISSLLLLFVNLSTFIAHLMPYIGGMMALRVYIFLNVMVVWPDFVVLYVLYWTPSFSMVVGKSSLRAFICGAIAMFLLWQGVRGLKQIIEAEKNQETSKNRN